VKERWGFLRLLIMAAFLTGTMSGCLGCGGGGNIKMQLDNTLEKPVWVGIYLLSKEAALDGRPNSDLTSQDVAKTFGTAEGVVDYELKPVYVNDPITFTREPYDPAVTTVLVAANFPKADPCARVKIPVKKGGDVKLNITVVDKCLKIAKSK
jgi:hypothetical protein